MHGGTVQPGTATSSVGPASGCFLCDPDSRLTYWRGTNFLALAGLGPVTDGYSLISTTAHVKSMADVPADHAAEQIIAVKKLRALLDSRFGGNCVITEHGRVPVCKDDGSQHDPHCYHAHFLAFPNAPDISEQTKTRFRSWKSFTDLGFALNYAREQAEYVLVSPSATEYTIFSKPLGLERQLTRHLVALAANVPQLSNWRQVPNWELALKIAENLGKELGEADHAE